LLISLSISGLNLFLFNTLNTAVKLNTDFNTQKPICINLTFNKDYTKTLSRITFGFQNISYF